jgi:proline iminopeptidase
MKKAIRIVGLFVLGLAIALVALFAIMYLDTLGDAQVAATVAQDPTIPHVTLDGVTFHAEAFGNPGNSAVIVVHGGPGADYRYLLNLQALADDYYVVFYDQRGTGLSPRVDPAELTMENTIADLDRIVEHYGGGEPVSIVGHSWGAMLASAYIGRHPEKVSRVALAEPGALTDEAYQALAPYLQRLDLPILATGTRAWFESLHVRGPDDQAAADHMWQTVMSAWNYAPWNGYNCPGAELPSDHAWRFSSASRNIIASATDEEGKVDTSVLHEGLDRYPNPVLLMASECDTWIGAEHRARFHLDLFQDAELLMVPDAGHDMFLDNPEASLAAVRAYLDTGAQAASTN